MCYALILIISVFILLLPITLGHRSSFLRPHIKRFCLTFTIGPDRIWFCLIQVSDFFLQQFLEFGQRFDLILIYDVTEKNSNHNIVLRMQFYSNI